MAVIGDEGIHEKLGNEFWQKVVNDLIKKFKENKKAEALAECIVECGEQLGKFSISFRRQKSLIFARFF